MTRQSKQSRLSLKEVCAHVFERELANMDEHFLKDVRKEKEYNVTKTARQDKVTGKGRN